MPVSTLRIKSLNAAEVNAAGDYVLYWMTANRRLRYNFSLQRAVDWSVQLRKPLLIFEALRCDYPWASVRFHRFVVEGMLDNQAAASQEGISYLSYLEPAIGHGRGLLQTLAAVAAVVISDDFPCFFLPAMTASAAQSCPVKFEVVDSNGLLPMAAAEVAFPTAYAFRRFLQKNLSPFLADIPQENPLTNKLLPRHDGLVPSLLKRLSDRWSLEQTMARSAEVGVLASLPIDQSVGVAVCSGGSRAAHQQLCSFLDDRLDRYAADRSQPDDDPSSGLSPYLHFGHISAHEVFVQLASRENWSPDAVGDVTITKGSRSGWWGMSDSAESFLDELITWRELGYNMCSLRKDYDQFHSLPDFAQLTLRKHSADARPWIYGADELRESQTHDDVWNAAQRQLVTEGRMHNYLRMLWGKKILEWSETPQQALEVMIDLNNRYAVDGRNPNSYSGIFWVLGRYDRAWGPERPIFGKIRYMSSDNTRRKLKLTSYLETYGSPTSRQKLF